MKKVFQPAFALLAIALFTFYSTKVDAQNPHVYGTAANNEGFLRVLPLGTAYYTVGQSSVPNPSVVTSQVTSIKTTLTSINWVKDLCGPQGESLQLTDIQESLSGNLIVVGNVFPGLSSGSNNRFYVAEIHAVTGAVLQSKIIARASSVRQLLPRIIKVSDCGAACGGAYIVSSWTDSGSPDNVFAMKLDYGLNVAWANDYEAGGDEEPSGLISTPTGGAIIAGHSSNNGWQNFLLEVDCQGNIVPAKTVAYKPTSGHVFLNYGITRAFNGDILLCGAAEVSLIRNATACRINGSTLAPVWSKIWDIPNPPHNLVLTAITQFPKSTGHVFAAGYTADLVNGGFEPRVIKYNFSNGATNYYRDFGSTGSSLGGALGLTSTATRILLAAVKDAPNPEGIGLNDGFLTAQPAALNVCGTNTTLVLPNFPLQQLPITFTSSSVQMTDSNHCCAGNLTWLLDDVCPVANKSTKPRGDNFEKNSANFDFEIFPNPAAETLEIVFENTEKLAGQQLQIMDLNGKVVKTESVENEATEILLDISDLPKGVYLVKIGDAQVQKLTKM